MQNPTELKAAFEDANNASGSALKENEKYLDSIQGKIDQFNNAVQTLWSNTLDSDVVKFFVDLATKLVKIVDTIGPLNIALVGLVAFLEKKHNVFSNFFNPAGSGATEAARQIDGSFDPEKAKRSLSAKKGNRTKRINKLQAEGKTFDEIQADPKVQQYTKDIEDAEQALNEYNATVQQTNATVQQASVTTQANTAANQANAASNTASASAETADATATNASTAAEVADTTATTAHTAATWKDVWAEMTRTGATGASVLATLKQVIATKLASSALVQKGLAIMGVTAAEGASIPVTTMLAAGFVGLTASIWSAITAMWTFMTTTPIGWILLAAGAVVALGAAFAAIHKSPAELREELSGLKSEISDIKSEIDSLNGELETTQERMAELLAKDSLTFTEQEELDNLQKQNDELERQIYLLEQKEKRLQSQAQNTFDKLMKKSMANAKRDMDGDGEKDDVFDRSLERRIGQYKNRIAEYESAQEELVQAEKELEAARASGDSRAIRKAENKVKRKENKVKRKEKRRDKKKGQIDDELAQYIEDAEGIDYATADAQTREYLDYINNTVGKVSILEGDAQAKSMEIKRIFNKDTMAGASEEIKKLVQELAKDPGNENIIAQISEQCKLAEGDLKAVGLSVQDATDYFTQLGASASFDTIEGKIREVTGAAANFEKLLNGQTFNIDGVEIGLADLFDKEGKIIQTTLSQVFKNTSAQTRADITRLLEGSYEQIQNGTVNVEHLLSGFSLKAAQQVIEIQNRLLAEKNIELFPNLKDEIDGIIDKFDELSKAIGSVEDAMDTLEQARAEEAYSGSISVETLENLMKYTNDYAQLVEVDETGAIKLVTNAEEILTQQRIEKIKADAAAAVQTAQLNLEQAKYNEQAVNDTGPIQQALTVATDWLAGSFAYLGSIIGDIADGNFKGILDRASQAFDNKISEREDKRTDANQTISVADAQKALDNALLQQKVADAWASGSMQYSSEDASGGKKTPEEVADERFQKEMEYWENRIAANQAKYEQLQNEIDLMEKKGQKADASFYKEQIALENERLFLLGEQKKAAAAHLATLEEGSEEWWEVANTLNDIEGELDDVTASIVDLQDAIGEIDTYKFEEFNNRLDNITSKLGTIRDLIAPNGEEDWFDDEGNWTEEGVAVLGTFVQDLETYKQGLSEATKAYNQFIYETNEDGTFKTDESGNYIARSYKGNEKWYADNYGIHSEQEYYDKTEELINQQYDYAKSINDTEQDIVGMYESSIDAVEEYVDTLIDGYNDYIDSVKEALDAERDLYDFKKNVQKQAKDIADIERRIMSLSGSTNAADIAERRRLEADLYGAREELDNTYYDHAKESQQNALDSEAEAYEENMTKFVEGLRTSLEEATANMDEFLMGVTSMVMYNADTILTKYEETNLPLTKELTNPWEEAKKAVGTYSGDALDLMNQWTKEGGFFAQFNASGTTNLTSPWSAGTTAANTFKTSVATVMSGVVSNINTNVQAASSALSNLYKQIQDTEKRAASANVTVNSGGSGGGGGNSTSTPSASVKTLQTILAQVYNKQVPVNGIWDTQTSNALKSVQKTIGVAQTGKYDYNTARALESNIKNRATQSRKNGYSADADWYNKYYQMVPAHFHAKGTTGTTRDEWAITDEPQFGDELVLVPGKDGNLSFMRKGTGVVPADLTANLMEWGQFTPDALNLGGGVNVNMINNAVNKPEFNFAFDALVKAENITEETLPAVKKLVTQELNRFTKELNYALKGKGAR